MGGWSDGWTCCIIVVVGVETVTDCLPACLPYSVENEPFGEINITAASQKIPFILCNLKDQHLVPYSLTLAPMPGLFISYRSFPLQPSSFQFMLIPSVHLNRFEMLLPFRFLFSHVHATCPMQLTSLEQKQKHRVRTVRTCRRWGSSVAE